MIRYQFILYFFLFIFLNLICIFLMNKDWKSKKTIALFIHLLSLMLITLVCFFPFPTDTRLVEDMIANNNGLSNNYIPFHTIYMYIKDLITHQMIGAFVYQVCGNVILFIPLGISSYLYFDHNKLRKAIIVITITTLSIEGLQFLFNYLIQINYRAVDIDDVILNFLGGLIGACILHYCSKLYIKFKRQ